MGREEWECDKWGQEWGAVANTSSNMDTDGRVGVGETTAPRC